MISLRMFPLDALQWSLVSNSSMREEIEKEISRPGRELRGALRKVRLLFLLHPKIASKFVVQQILTDRSTEMMRLFLSEQIPLVKKIRATKHELLHNMPDIFYVRKNCLYSETYPVNRLRVKITKFEEVVRGRISLKDDVQKHLISLQYFNEWSTPPKFKATEGFEISPAVILMVRIDSGTWSTTLMAQFIREGAGKKLNDVLLIAEALDGKKPPLSYIFLKTLRLN